MGREDAVRGVVEVRQCLCDAGLCAGIRAEGWNTGACGFAEVAEEAAKGDRAVARALLRSWGVWRREW